jgi:Bacterial PH domain
MGILRVIEWRSTQPVDRTDALIRSAMESVSLQPAGAVGTIAATSKRSLLKNRFSAELRAEIAAQAGGSSIRWQVDMPGTKHFDLLEKIADHLPDGVLDDRGIAAAGARVGLLGVLGRKEYRHLHNVLGADETVIRLGQGQYRGKQGFVVLTTDRLFFIDKSLPTTESIDAFRLASVAAVTVQKSRVGETLVIHTAGMGGEISHMAHGQAGGFAGALRDLRSRLSDRPAVSQGQRRPGHAERPVHWPAGQAPHQ